MLVLSRKKDEEIVIDRKIRIRIVEIRDGKVRIGITAPREISVHRSEVQEAIDSKAEVIAIREGGPAIVLGAGDGLTV